MRLKKELIIVILLALPIVLALDSDRDGIPDDNDSYPYDFDNDGLPDNWEIKNGLRYNLVDSKLDNDNDGFTNLEEYSYGTDPNSGDSDGDAISDYKEIKELGTNPLKKEGAVWPLVVFPVLIIIFVLILFLMHEYKLDVVIKEYFSKKKKEEINPEFAREYLRQEAAPPIPVTRIDKLYKKKQEEKQRVLGAFGAAEKPANQFAEKKVYQSIGTEFDVPVQETKEPLKKETNKKDVFENLRKIKK